MNLKISALEFIEEAKNGNISVEEFVSATLERINSVDDKLHAFLSVNDNALDQARNIDKKIKSGEKVGDCLECQFQLKTTCASRTLKLHVLQKCLKTLLHHTMQQ